MPRFDGVSAGTVLSAQNALIASTLPRISKEVADNFFRKLPFFFYLKAKNRVKWWKGGESWEEGLMYADNPTAKEYDDFEVMDVLPPSGFGNAVYLLGKYRVGYDYARSTVRANSGDAAIYSLVQKIKMQAEKSLMNAVNTDLFRAAASAPTNLNKVTSLFYMLEKGTFGSGQTSIVGGISKATNTWWNNRYNACADAAATKLKTLRTNVVACSDGSDVPDLGLCDDLSYLLIEDLVFGKRTFVNSDLADFGFANVVYNGVTYMYDKSIPNEGGDHTGDGTIFHINTEYLYLAIDPETNFMIVAPEYEVTQDAFIGAILLGLQLVCNNLARQGILDNTGYST